MAIETAPLGLERPTAASRPASLPAEHRDQALGSALLLKSEAQDGGEASTVEFFVASGETPSNALFCKPQLPACQGSEVKGAEHYLLGI